MERMIELLTHIVMSSDANDGEWLSNGIEAARERLAENGHEIKDED